MLCFGDYNNHSSDGELVVFGETTTTTTAATYSKSTPQKSGVTACSDSSSASSGNNSIAIANTPSKSNKKRNGSGKESVQCSNSITTTPVANQRTSKKTKADNSSSTGHAKPRKEKLGERISTLQQLVSPLARLIQHQCYMKRWVISGFCKNRFRFCALHTCNNTTTYLTAAEKTEERREK
ncbi:hypothetical protein LWI29_018364 [Acer saccharum]|uniref:Uncharacterized protein n=1 Tax=Acer saccharum TaxID=4024 RepID=A0AA39S2B7_ACESA|nr:hypothetical protein LWI29_018364 [Acer saccharum]